MSTEQPQHPTTPPKDTVIFSTNDDKPSVSVQFDQETAWLSLEQMANLFERDKSTISRHIKNIFSEGELVRETVVANFATTATDNKTYQVEAKQELKKYKAKTLDAVEVEVDYLNAINALGKTAKAATRKQKKQEGQS